ncbi:MAG: hypothetical protein AW07_04419 [Candidatus Accumulibacter sp. SK-11]|nr:MAG: hypothetical protein AW07_04419 [Candidatus Accumulibacter sp. SK-11]
MRTITRLELIAGGATTSLLAFAFHKGVPSKAEKASTSPFAVPTTTIRASAPTPPATFDPTLILHAG